MTQLNQQLSFMDKLRVIDIFGSKINLTFKGNHTYKTKIGAVLSILFLILLIAVTTSSLIKVFSKTILAISMSKRFLLFEQLGAFNPGERKFGFAFGI